MLCAAHIDAANVELSWIGLGKAEQFAQVRKFGFLWHHNGNVKSAQDRQGRKVFLGVVWQAFEEARTDSRGIGH